MKKVQISIEQSPEGEWWIHSPEATGFFAYGETREEALTNAKDALSIFLDVDEDSLELMISESKNPANGN